jgi:hypothetical protein
MGGLYILLLFLVKPATRKKVANLNFLNVIAAIKIFPKLQLLSSASAFKTLSGTLFEKLRQS